MRLPVCALFLLTASRLFGTAVASVTCGPITETNYGASFASAFCSSASATVSLGAVNVSQSGGRASASIAADYTLLVTGGTGQGTFRMVTTKSLNTDPTDEGYVDITLGNARYYRDNSGLVFDFGGTFTYGVPQDGAFMMSAGVASFTTGFPPHGGAVSASFSGVQIFQDSILVPDAVVTLQLSQYTPEPSFSVAVGLLTLVFAARAWQSRRFFPVATNRPAAI